ncbi:hypothetical protein GY21_06295 [Cryobacterium roopkundense]|uniref:CAAX prenyl protease 2/Lysostaphin resistance protein A-like domain-containing protein n=1 Tax=Cryobacterium roopkundense TaxID=1001240 RepID=A0A099JN08_9MICO|nr:hypothetical protein GY21_06295 [Cryobacterium roopkundense]
MALSFLQYSKGINPELTSQAVILVCTVMICVGLLEELIFRGILFQAIISRGTVIRAIYLCGFTFRFGHVVNLLRGYSPVDQLIQLVAAIAIGVTLGYCVAITRSILPGVLFHILFNVSGSLTNHDPLWDTVLVALMVVVLVPYIAYLHRVLSRLPHLDDEKRAVLATAAPTT